MEQGPKHEIFEKGNSVLKASILRFPVNFPVYAAYAASYRYITWKWKSCVSFHGDGSILQSAAWSKIWTEIFCIFMYDHLLPPGINLWSTIIMYNKIVDLFL